VTICPRCSEPAAAGQEYCLTCGAHLSVPGTRGRRGTGSGWIAHALVSAVVALAGAAAALAATGGRADSDTLTTAIGGFVTAPGSGTAPSPVEPGPSGIADWPQGQDGWTIALASHPQSEGRRAADAGARQARAKGLAQVGVLDSSRYASLHPGYWIVFSGVYSSEAEAASALERARRFAKTASVRRIVA